MPPTSFEGAVTSGDERTVDVSEFAAEEQSEMSDCFASWLEFTGGAVNLRAVQSDGDLKAHRGSYKSDSTPVYVKRVTQEAWLDPSRGSIRKLCLHAVGRAAGLKTHDSPGALATALEDLTDDFSTEDKAECQTKGVCQ